MTTAERAAALIAAIQAWHARNPQASFNAVPRPCTSGGHPGQEPSSYHLTPAGHAALERAAGRLA